jgi:GT2 family glycosyltransferase
VLVLPAPPAPRVSIIVVTAGSPDRLVRCLAAVAREAPRDLAYEVVVVLNAAERGVHDCLRTQVEGARIVTSDIPLGFAGGLNAGARHARGELLHLLHDDTIVCAGWLGRLIAALEAHPEAGAAGSLLFDLDGGGVQTAGHVLWRDGLTSPPWTASAPDAASFGEAYPADYCASASLLIRRIAWQAIGGVDEDFHPAYYVDVDLAMSLRDQGYVVICEPASRVHHERGGSSREKFRTFISQRNRERFVAKWAGDLEHQEPSGGGEEGLARARRATAIRAQSVAGSGPRRAPRDVRTEPEEHDELERLRRERHQLQRDLAVKDAYIDHAERQLSEAASLRARLEAELAASQHTVAELHEAKATVDREYAGLARAHDALRAEAAVELMSLRERARTLDAIESGGWWQLRGRLLPVLALGGRVRSSVRRWR